MNPRPVDTRVQFHLSERERDHLQQYHDLHGDTLKRIGNNPERNRVILDELLALPREYPTLVFGCSVQHARALALLLRRAGRMASAVSNETPTALRRRWISDFRNGYLQYLCNFGVLTTGFDAPQVRVIAIARPTASVLLYEQMVGRGMRGPENGGTEECLVIDFVDSIQQFGDQMSYQRYADMWARQRQALEAARRSGNTMNGSV